MKKPYEKVKIDFIEIFVEDAIMASLGDDGSRLNFSVEWFDDLIE